MEQPVNEIRGRRRSQKCFAAFSGAKSCNLAMIIPFCSMRTWTSHKDGEEPQVTINGRVRVTAAEIISESVFCRPRADDILQVNFYAGTRAWGRRNRFGRWKLLEMDLWAVFPAGRLATAKTRASVAFMEPG
jgi:hypothetical protein